MVKRRGNKYLVQSGSAINYDRLAEAIVAAEMKASAIQQEEKNRENEENLKEWHKKMWQKEIDPNSNILSKIFTWLRNILFGFIKMVIFCKKDISENQDRATNTFLYMITNRFVRIFMWIFYLLFDVFLFFSIKYGENSTLCIVLIIIALLCLTVASLLRMMSYEIEVTNDRDLLINISSYIVSFVALIVSVISLLVSLRK